LFKLAVVSGDPGEDDASAGMERAMMAAGLGAKADRDALVKTAINKAGGNAPCPEEDHFADAMEGNPAIKPVAFP
jgi:hypothetical protein